MTNLTYGLIVEGPYDQAMYGALIPRICGGKVVFTRPCGGVERLMKLFHALLRDFEHAVQGGPVDKALVIRDSSGKDPIALEAEMAATIQGMQYVFPRGIKLCIVRRTMETWLLADAQAITDVARARGGRQVQDVQGTLEDIGDPKKKLRSVLSDAGIEYTDVVCAEIAALLRIDHVEYRCPSFRTFRRDVIDC